MRRKAQPCGGLQVPDYTLAYLVREGYAARQKKTRSARWIVLALILVVFAALLAGAGIWYWSAGSKSMSGRHTPGSLPPQQSGYEVPPAGAPLAAPLAIRSNCKLFRNKAPSLLENSQNFVSWYRIATGKQPVSQNHNDGKG